MQSETNFLLRWRLRNVEESGFLLPTKHQPHQCCRPPYLTSQEVESRLLLQQKIAQIYNVIEWSLTSAPLAMFKIRRKRVTMENLLVSKVGLPHLESRRTAVSRKKKISTIVVRDQVTLIPAVHR
jgi:hypothetical protein